MRYQIEYLTDTADEKSVVDVLPADAATLEAAGRLAWENPPRIERKGGFQIRDMEARGRIVALEAFARDPSEWLH